MHAEEQDDLWELLGHARQPEVSPFFSRNVLRQIRTEAEPAPGLLAALRRQWQFAAVTAAACLILGLSLVQIGERPAPAAALAQQIDRPSDYEVIEDLDVLLASDTNSAWLDQSNFTF